MLPVPSAGPALGCTFLLVHRLGLSSAPPLRPLLAQKHCHPRHLDCLFLSWVTSAVTQYRLKGASQTSAS